MRECRGRFGSKQLINKQLLKNGSKSELYSCLNFNFLIRFRPRGIQRGFTRISQGNPPASIPSPSDIQYRPNGVRQSDSISSLNYTYQCANGMVNGLKTGLNLLIRA